MAQMIQRAW